MDHVMHHFTGEESRVPRGWVPCLGMQKRNIQPGALPTLPILNLTPQGTILGGVPPGM